MWAYPQSRVKNRWQLPVHLSVLWCKLVICLIKCVNKSALLILNECFDILSHCDSRSLCYISMRVRAWVCVRACMLDCANIYRQLINWLLKTNVKVMMTCKSHSTSRSINLSDCQINYYVTKCLTTVLPFISSHAPYTTGPLHTQRGIYARPTTANVLTNLSMQ